MQLHTRISGSFIQFPQCTDIQLPPESRTAEIVIPKRSANAGNAWN